MTRAQKFEKFQSDTLNCLNDISTKLDKIVTLLASNQLLQECISPEGTVRSAEECGHIVLDSYYAALCLSGELDNKVKQYKYQQSEFFLNEEEPTDNTDNNSKNDDNDSRPRIPTRF